MTMTIASELHTRSRMHRLKMAQALSMMSRLVRWERFATGCVLTARVEVHTDHELRKLLDECSEFWEFDTSEMVLVRKHATSEDVRLEIGVNGMPADDVYRIIAETEPCF